MAGALAIVFPEQAANTLATSTRGEWQVQFARYFTLPDVPSQLSSTCPSLVLLPDNYRYRPTRGTWISTSSTNASFHIVNNNVDAAILSVCFRGKILEEHYISKLQFSWPQVSCVSGFPPRGSRAVFVSYIDSANEIQKFALRFSTLDEVEIFINSLKAILEDTTQIKPVYTDFKSDISCQSDFMSSNIPLSSHQEEKPIPSTPLYTPQLPQTMNCEYEQHSYTQRMTPNPNIEGLSLGLPPSFMLLLSNCVPVVKQEQFGLTEVNLRSQIVSYMEDSAFQEMLCKVEKVINEMGDDMSLKDL